MPLLHQIYDFLSSHAGFSSKIALLPPSSWHMTIIEGVTDVYREEALWPPLKNTVPVQDYTAEVSAKLKQLDQSLVEEGLTAAYCMRVDGFQPLTAGIALRLEATSSDEDTRVRRLRDRIADEALGFRMPGHDNYEFHVSIAYLLQHLSDSEQTALGTELEGCLHGFRQLEFGLDSAEFCVFDDMFAFHRQSFIAEKVVVAN